MAEKSGESELCSIQALTSAESIDAGFAIFIDVLKERLAGQLLAALDDPHDARIADLELLADPGLTLEREPHLSTQTLGVARLQGREAERTIGAPVFGVADAGEGGVEEVNDRRQHPFARQAGKPQRGVDSAPESRQGRTEGRQPFELLGLALRSERRVVDVLLATARVAAGGLEVAELVAADPDVGPTRRDGESADSIERRAVANRIAVGPAVAKRFAVATAVDPRRCRIDEAQ